MTLRTAWNWARRQLGLAEEFPGTGLDFAKIEESLPFMTWKRRSDGSRLVMIPRRSGIAFSFVPARLPSCWNG